MIEKAETRPESARGYSLQSSLLAVEDLSIEFPAEHGWVRVVNDLHLTVARGQIVGLVGESGSGKTVTSLAIMGLLRASGARTPTGSIRFDGRELLGAPERVLTQVRGPDIAMIFQEPRRSLDPAFTVGEQIAEVVRRHTGQSRKAAWRRAVQMLDTVGIADASRRSRQYPHEFSGGMCQRVMLAGAVVCEPRLLIADEPTTALDATVQARMLRLMNELQEQFGLAILFVTHDLGVVAQMCDHVAVMYAGQVVEQGERSTLFASPEHPYTEGLLSAAPDMQAEAERLRFIPGAIPPAGQWPSGCRFHPRCAHAVAGRCDVHEVPLTQSRRGRLARCLRADELVLQGVS